MARKSIYHEIEKLPPNTWLTLDEVCDLIGTKSKSHVKMHLLLHDKIHPNRKLVSSDKPINLGVVWRWEFIRIEDKS